MEKTYYIPIAYEKCGRIPIEAETLEEAWAKAEDDIHNVPLNVLDEYCEYLDESEEVDHDAFALDEHGHITE